MLSKKTIKKYGLDTKSLKAVFTAEKPKPKHKKLIELIANRQREGKLRNLGDAKTWAAVDLAYDAPLTNSQSAILRSILEKGGDEKSILASLRNWGLNPECLFCKGDSVKDADVWIPNYPMLYNVTIPLVRAYLTIRLANIFNERNVTPLFDYQPSKYNAENRVLCEILTSIVESIATNYGYPPTLRKWIFNALMYSVSIKFPVESWDIQKQEDGNGVEYVEKQGIRYIVPHVSNVYYDFNYPLHTLNTGTGCSYAGYWTVIRYGEVADNPIYWNRDEIPFGENWLDGNATWATYFREISPCTLDFPVARSAKKETDREKIAAQTYARGDYDSAFFIGYLFMEIVPADWDIGDGKNQYENRVWMKFTVGADDVIMFAETFGYSPPPQYIGYDADDGRGRNCSLAQEIQPSQEMASNILCQHLSTIKRNLTNIQLYNTQAIDKEQIRRMNLRSQSQFQQLNFLGFDGLQMEKAGVDMANIFQRVQFTPANTQEILGSLNTVLAMLERTLVMSAQEVGGAASHQQGNKEIEIINNSTSNRLAFTASHVDEGIDAWKRQLVEAAKCHMDTDEVEAQISVDIPDLDTHLEKLGFERVDKNPAAGQRTVTVKGKLSALKLTQFVSRRADKDRQTDMAAAQAMLQAIAAISQNQLLSGIADPTSLMELVEQAAKLAGADDDFKVRINQDAVMSGLLQKSIQKIQQLIMQQVEKTVVEPATKAIAEESQKIDSVTQNVAALTGVVEQLKQLLPPQPVVQPALQPPAGAPPVVQPA